MFDAMRELFRAGVDCGVESYQGTGFVAWIVDPQNRRCEKCFAPGDLEAIPGWMFSEAMRLHYPNVDEIERTPRHLLDELAHSSRKPPRRVTPQQTQRGSGEEPAAS